MVLAVGATNFEGIAVAGAFNSLTSVGSFNYMPVHPGGLKLNKPLLFSKQTRGMAKRFGRYGQQQAEGNVVGDLFFEGWDRLIGTGFHRVSTPGTNFNTHVYTVPDDTGAFDNVFGTVLLEHKDFKTFQFLSAFLKKLTLSFSEEPFVAFSADMIAASRSRITSATPTFGTLAPANPFGNGTTTGLVIAVTVGGSTFSQVYAKSASLGITIPTEFAKSVTSQTPIKVMRNGQYVAEGQWVWNLSSNDTLSELWMAAGEAETQATNLTFTITGGTIPASAPATPYSIQVSFPTCYLKIEDPVVSGSGAIDQSFSFEAGVTNNATTSPVTITMVNNMSLP